MMALKDILILFDRLAWELSMEGREIGLEDLFLLDELMHEARRVIILHIIQKR